MSIELYVVFFVASALLVATPGPNVALIVGTSLTHGARTGPDGGRRCQCRAGDPARRGDRVIRIPTAFATAPRARWVRYSGLVGTRNA